MTSQDLTAAVAILISLGLSYIPGLAPKWDGLDPTWKRLIMVGLLLAVAGGAYGLACAGWAAELGFFVTCDKPGLMGLVKAFVIAVIANQSVYKISPKPDYARAWKSMRG